jgi:hypothetical protein
VLFEDGIFARWDYFLFVVALNPLFWIMAVEGAMAAWRNARAGERKDWLPLILALPALTPLIYRNAYEYYYPFILAPAAILVALFFEKHRALALKASKSLGASVLPIMLAVQCVLGAFHVWRNLPDEIAPQRTTLAAVHAVFPRPVRYIDGYGVVATFPRSGPFMSSWGMEKYHEASRPLFADLVAKTQPPLLLADAVSLYGAMVPGISVAIPELTLLPTDAAFLRDNYLPHGGMLFVAGKQLKAAAGSEAAFDIAVAGDYRLEAAAPVVIDGQSVQAGAIVTLAAGSHQLGAAAAAQDATLRWANARQSPDDMIGILEFFAAGK